MAIVAEMIDDKNIMEIKPQGDFNYSSHSEFQKSFETGEEGVTKFVINMETVNSMDSSALGMLLQLLDYAGGMKESVKIINCNPTLLETLRISNFYSLMEIE